MAYDVYEYNTLLGTVDRAGNQLVVLGPHADELKEMLGGLGTNAEEIMANLPNFFRGVLHLKLQGETSLFGYTVKTEDFEEYDDVVEYYNPNQRRHPAGSPEGGRFAPVGGTATALTAEDKALHNYLSGIAKIQQRPTGFHYNSVEEYVLRNGTAFTASYSLPAGVRPAKKGECYRNAWMLANNQPDRFTYVEGFASQFGIPFAHAWVVDRTGHVVDPTWVGHAKDKLDGKLAYYGVKMPIEFVNKTIIKRRKFGVLYDPEQGFPLLRSEVQQFREWDESAHPRHPAGTSKGGEFAPKGSGDSGSYQPCLAGASMLEGNDGRGLDTLSQFNCDGSFTPERKALHDRIVEEFLAGHEPVVNPVSYLMGGGGASGKSVMQAQFTREMPKDMVRVDVDMIRIKLPEWDHELENAKLEGRKVNTYLGAYTHEEASIISKRIIDESVKRSYNLLVDGAGDSSIQKVAENAARYAKGGRKLVANYVTVDYDMAYARMRARGDVIGRYIPAVHLREVHSEVARVFPEAVKRGLFSESTLWDTTSSKDLGNGQFSPPVKVASAIGNKLVIHDQAAWNSFLERGKGIAPREGEI